MTTGQLFVLLWCGTVALWVAWDCYRTVIRPELRRQGSAKPAANQPTHCRTIRLYDQDREAA